MRYAIIALLTCVSFAQTLPDAPSASKKKVADAQFWALTAFNAAATAVDAITTAKLVSHTEACPYEVGTPALYGDRAPDGRVIAVMAAKAGAATLTSYLLKRYNIHVWKIKLWYLPLAFNGYSHAVAAGQNMRNCR
jgi:hypothetical protein